MEPANDNDQALDYRLCVYLIESMPSRAVKIGVAREPWDRLKGLQIGNHEKLRVVAAFWGGGNAQLIERTMHDLLKPWHLHGEWFEGKWHEIFRACKLAMARADRPELWRRYWAFAKARQNAPRLVNGWKWLWRIHASIYVPEIFDLDSPQLVLL